MKRKKRTTLIAYGLIFLGVVGLIISVILYSNQPKPPPIANGVTSVHVAPAPSSVKPSSAAIATYTVAPTLPKYISIPTIGVTNVRIIQLGLASSGQIATPDNIYDTGWYDGSAKPGQPGAMFIYGHVSSWTADGVFYDLKKLKPGDIITVTRGDNQTYTYQVEATKIYGYNSVDMNTVLSTINSTLPGLNLMTCTGQVIKGTSEFNQRLVVFSSLVKT
jgi:LPXTG-site transpeptidase (sortase) family protein